MKKILFGLGTVAAVVAPVVSVVACGDKAETKINGKTAKEIKAMSTDDFTTFLNDTLHKAQPETVNGSVEQKRVKFAVKNENTGLTLTYTDKNGALCPLNVSDTTSPEFLAALGIYTTVGIGVPATAAQSKAGGEVKAWWKDVVDAAKIYFAK